MKRKFGRVLLHFGGGKTGSTAIQKALTASQTILLESKLVAYPPGEWHAQLGSVFCKFPERYIFNIETKQSDSDFLKKNDQMYLDELNEWLETVPECEYLVFSYEGFVDLDVDALVELKGYCHSFAEEVNVLLYVRPPLSYAVSAMSQYVKQGGLIDFNYPPIAPYQMYLEKIMLVFGKENVCVRLFSSEALRNGDVVSDFMSVLNVSDDIAEKVSTCKVSVNKSLSDNGLHLTEILIRYLNEIGVNYSQHEFYEKYGRHLTLIPGERIRLSAEIVNKVLISSKPHTDFLEQEFGISLREDIQKYLPSTDNTAKRSIPTDFIESVGIVLANIVANKHENHPDFSISDLIIGSTVLREGYNISNGQVMTFDVDFLLTRKVSDLEMGIHIFDSDRRWAFGINSTLLGQSHSLLSGSYCVTHRLIANLPVGTYTAGFAFTEKLPEGQQTLAWYDVLLEFQVHHQEFQVHQSFVGYSYLPAQINLSPTQLAKPELIVFEPVGSILLRESLSCMAAKTQTNIRIEIINQSKQTWIGDVFHPINLSYHWLNESNETVEYDGLRSPLPKGGIKEGQSLITDMLVNMPSKPGAYRLILTLVQENVAWFEDSGNDFQPAIIDVIVNS